MSKYYTPCPSCGANLDPEEKCECLTKDALLDPIEEYASTFAKNHGITLSEAFDRPMVKAYAEVYTYNRTQGRRL